MRRRRLKAAQITLAKTIGVDSRLAGVATGSAPSERLKAVAVHIQDPEDPNKTIEFYRPMRDPLNWYHHIGTFDKPQHFAGELYRHYIKSSQFGLSGIDTTKTAVDGGKVYEQVSDYQLRAAMLIRECHKEWRAWGKKINEDTMFIMESFLMREWFPGTIAATLGRYGDRNTREIAGRVKDGLQMAAYVFTNCS